MSDEKPAKLKRHEWIALGLTGLGLLIWTLVRSKTELQWDEGRYLAYARNLLHGKYASEETLFLWNGPGFPVVVALVQLFHLPLVAVKILNVGFLVGTLLYFRTFLIHLGISHAWLFAVGLGLYLTAHGALPELIMSECLAVFLAMASTCHSARFFRGGIKGQGAMAAFFLGWLALTKVFFGYVLLAGTILSLGYWLWHKSLGHRAATVCAGALVVAAPYLIYTHALTGKFFYWGNSGGAQLYCLTLPENRFLGDWLNSDAVMQNPEFFGSHSDFYRKIESMDFVARNEALKSSAIKNIREHPAKFFKNWRSNVNRMVFGYPVTNYPGAAPELSTGNRSMVYALPFMLALFSIPTAFRRKFPFELKALMVFLAISLSGSSLLSAVPRQVFPLLPLMWIWILFAFKMPEKVQA